MARPTKLTPETAKRIVDFVRAGNYGEHAALAAGVSTTTYYAWMARGRDAARNPETGDCIDPDDTPYAEFQEAIKSAEGEAIVRAMENIRLAGPTSWQASAWYLERKFPEQFGRRDHNRVEVSGPQGGPIQVDSKAALLAALAEVADDGETTEDDPAAEPDPTATTQP